MTGVSLSDRLDAFDLDAVTDWLAASYWSPGISRARVEQGARHSTVCAGAFADGRQIGFARVISDTTRFAYLCDVIVDTAWRGRGIGTRLTEYLLAHERLRTVENWYLITADAQEVYRPHGFAEFCRPDRTVMSLHRS